MLIKGLVYFAVCSLVFTVAYKIPISYKYSDLNSYAAVLMGVSSMVFTLMGIWIAFLYPNALQRLMDPETVENSDFSTSLSETKRLEGLVGSVLRSAFVVVVLMLLALSKVVVTEMAFVPSYAVLIKSLVLSIVIVLSFLQLESIFYVIYSNVMFINELHTKREDKEADADI